MAGKLGLVGGFGPAPDLPENVSVPVVTGTPTVGQTLSASQGSWIGFPPPTFSYQWLWGDTSANIVGATSPTYLLVAGDATHTIKCAVTATNQLGGATATSAATAAVSA